MKLHERTAAAIGLANAMAVGIESPTGRIVAFIVMVFLLGFKK